jgi:translation initiation factor IF-1
MFDPPITTTGTVIDSPKEKIYHVSLPNGKIIIGHVPKALIALHDQIVPETTVRLELTPYDLSKGRIVGLVTDSPDD